jgi:hypothetical protein
MSMAEFYIDHGIDPGDPDSFDAWMEGEKHGDYDGAHMYRAQQEEGFSFESSYLEQQHREQQHREQQDREQYREQQYRGQYREQQRSIAAVVQRDRARSDERSKWPLDESELDYIGETRGWTRLKNTQPAMASYKKAGTRLNFYLSTGTVGSYLDHPTQGRTQLFRKITMAQASKLFDNPRVHTGEGYHTVQQREEMQNQRNESDRGAMLCCQCHVMKARDSFSKNQCRKGNAARCVECVNKSNDTNNGTISGDSEVSARGRRSARGSRGRERGSDRGSDRERAPKKPRLLSTLFDALSSSAARNA